MDQRHHHSEEDKAVQNPHTSADPHAAANQHHADNKTYKNRLANRQSGSGKPQTYFDRFRKKPRFSRNPWELLEKSLLASVTEQRRARRWGIFFKSLIFIYLFSLVFYNPLRHLLPTNEIATITSSSQPHIGIIKIQGTIGQDMEANAESITEGLKQAFANPQSKAIVLAINSPGGSPVHSGRIYDQIMKLKQESGKPVYAVISDLGASGAYYIAAAADQIYAYPTSLVGSIGVISAGFGFDQAMEKLGIERRLITSGKHKAFLDPFSPTDQENQVFWQNVLDGVHQVFISSVKKTRADKIKPVNYEQVFSGLVFNGTQALELGLIDHFGTVQSLAEDALELDNMIDYSQKKTPFDRLTEQLGIRLYQGFVHKITQLQWF